MHFPQIHGALSVIASQCHLSQRERSSTSPSALTRCHLPYRGEALAFRKVNGFARGSPTRGNGDDRRQWRKQGGAVGAAASKTQAERGGCWEPQPGLVERSRLRGCTKTETFLCRKVRLLASPVSFWRNVWYNGFAALPAHFIREGGESNELYSIFCSVCRSKCNVVLHLQVA